MGFLLTQLGADGSGPLHPVDAVVVEGLVEEVAVVLVLDPVGRPVVLRAVIARRGRLQFSS